jgi:Protein of unknown function (DUF4038)/Putative collagen-binding domain of a collagenase/Fibronectin type III domain
MEAGRKIWCDAPMLSTLGNRKRCRGGWLALQVVFPLLISPALVAEGTAAPAYPLKMSVNKRYLVDSSNAPTLMIGDAPHSIVVNLATNDVVTYMTNRGSNGVNTLWIELLCDYYTRGYGSEGSANYGRDINGNNPFTDTLSGGYYDLTTPNPAYWSNVDYTVQTAATNGLQCMFTPLDQGGWTQTSLANGTNRCYQYGQFLGNRYKNSPNITWNMGNDFQYWATATNDSMILAIADGIKSVDTNHLLTVQLNYSISQSMDDTNWAKRITVNGVYTYYPIYDETIKAYNKTNLPVLFLEANYEYENNTGAEAGTPRVLRLQEYWSLLAGALAGHMYGNHYTWTFTSGWQTQLNTTGMEQLAYFNGFFTNRAWYNLVPDTNHVLVTAGYGSYDGSSSSLTFDTNTYSTAAKTPDGTLGIVYTPVSNTLTVALSVFTNTVTAIWFDPSTNTFTAIPGSPFTNTGTATFTTPGNNSAGDGDWVLLLETQPLSIIAPQITACGFSNNDFVVSFTTVLGQTYELQRKLDLVSSSWSSIATNIDGTGGTVQAADTNAAKQVRQFYRVKTYHSLSMQGPTAPGSLAATAVGGTQVQLTWSPSTGHFGITGYFVERQDPGSTNFAQIGTATGINYIDTGLVGSTNYSYRVRATDAVGSLSPYSPVASATTLAGAVASDNFNRPDGNLGPSWTKQLPASDNNLVITNNQVGVDVDNGASCAFWTANSFVDDQYSQITITELGGGGSWPGVILRADSTDRFYLGLLAGPNQYEIWRRWDGAYYLLASGTTETWQVGDTFRMEIKGSANPITVTIFRNGNPVLSWTSTDPAQVKTGGSPGIGIYSPSGLHLTLDNWEGGNLPPDTQLPIAPQITALAFSNSDFVVSFTTVLGQKYELQIKSDLTSGSWSSTATNIPGTGGIIHVDDTNALSQFQRFYRVKTGM